MIGIYIQYRWRKECLWVIMGNSMYFDHCWYLVYHEHHILIRLIYISQPCRSVHARRRRTGKGVWPLFQEKQNGSDNDTLLRNETSCHIVLAHLRSSVEIRSPESNTLALQVRRYLHRCQCANDEGFRLVQHCWLWQEDEVYLCVKECY